VQQRKLFEDHRANALEILQHFVIPEPQHTEGFAVKKLCSLAVVLSDVRVLTTVDLDHQTVRKADEIENVTPHRLLSADLEPRQLSTAENAPERSLGDCHLSP